MRSSVSRRAFVSGAAATLFALPTSASEQAPIILRPEIEGVHPRYARYASTGDYLSPTPIEFRYARTRIIVFFPQGARSGRLVVFSHGALSDPLSYSGLLQHWATHGFVVAAPTHDDSPIERGLTIRRSSAQGVAEWRIPTLLEDAKSWKDRADACAACIDAAELIGKATGVKVNTDRPAIAGHGYGAFVAQLLMGAKVTDSDGNVLRLRDPRFFAAILMSPQGAGVMGLREDSWSEVASPLLVFLAENERDFTGQPPERSSDPFRLSKPGYKHLAFLKGGVSNAYTGQVAGMGPGAARLFEVVRAVSTAFLLSYSAYEEEAFADLTTDFFRRMSLGLVVEDRR
jgi:Predicted dienelactone hydrolase